jgi:hypothetical protein
MPINRGVFVDNVYSRKGKLSLLKIEKREKERSRRRVLESEKRKRKEKGAAG